MSRVKRPASRIDLGEQGRHAIRISLEDFLREQDLELSDLRMRLLVDHLEDHVGRHFYNRGIEDAATAAGQSVARLQDDMDLLRKI